MEHFAFSRPEIHMMRRPTVSRVVHSPARRAFLRRSAPKVHELKASARTVHRGFFDASLKPVLTIDSGDIVKLETATGNPRLFRALGVPKEKIPRAV